MYRANISWIALKDALRTLEEKGILKSEIRGKEIYISLTNEGYRLLERFNGIERAFSNDSLGVQTQLPIKSAIGYPEDLATDELADIRNEREEILWIGPGPLQKHR